MKTYRVEIHPGAKAGIRDAIGYIRADSPANAAAYFNGLEDAILSLATFPARGAVARESEKSEHVVRQLIYKSHRILFTVLGDTVHVLHVRHGRQRELDDVRNPTDEHDGP